MEYFMLTLQPCGKESEIKNLSLDCISASAQIYLRYHPTILPIKLTGFRIDHWAWAFEVSDHKKDHWVLIGLIEKDFIRSTIKTVFF